MCSSKIAVIALSLLAVTTAASAQLVTNGGFETGNLTGWSGGDSQITVNTADPHSGSYALYMSSNAPDKTLYQSIATTAGDEYQVSFWLTDVHVRDPLTDHFAAYFGGTAGVEDGQQLLNVTNLGPQPYTEYSYDVTASSSSTYLKFFENNVNDIFYLDDVQVSAVSASTPEPGNVALIIGLGLSSTGLLCRRRRA